MGSVITSVLGIDNSSQGTDTGGMAGFTHQDFMPGIQQGQQNFNQNISNQSNLANMLNQRAQGNGPSPAQLQLQQAQQQNVQQQAGLMASQRGLNPALAARMAAQNAANTGQQMAGQSAIMGANEQINAQNQLAGLYGQMGQQQLGNQSILQGGLANQNQSTVQGSLGAQGITAGANAQNAQTSGNIVGGMLGGLGTFGVSQKAHGGMIDEPVQHLALGGFAGAGQVNPNQNPYLPSQIIGGENPFTPKVVSSNVAKYLGGAGGGGAGAEGAGAEGMMGADGMASMAMLAAARGGQVDMRRGGHVPGQASVKGDSYANDKVPAMLSPKEIVIPRSVTMSKNAPDKAKAFVAAVLAQKRARGSK